MEEITAVELAGFSELLTHEENIIKKYKCYAQTCEEPGAQRNVRGYGPAPYAAL